MNRYGVLQRVLFLCLLIGGSLYITGCLKKTSASFEVYGNTMGTTYQVTVVAPPRNVNRDSTSALVTAELERLTRLMSTYDPESELSRFNAQQTTDWFPLAKETIELINTARRVSKDTSGAYDVTMGSVSALWGFGEDSPDNGETEIPEMDEIMLMLNNIGYQLLQVSSNEGAVRKLASGLLVDLSSIGKGFAVDRLGELLESEGVTRYLVEIGGEIRTRGMAADGERWKIGIEWPTAGPSEVPSGLALENAHVATSGDYRNYKEVNGQRYSHLLDGRTGFPISHNLASVTILHGSTTLADAWATAFMVLGYKDALAIAIDKGLAASFTVREGSGFAVHTTPAFDAYSFTTH